MGSSSSDWLALRFMVCVVDEGCCQSWSLSKLVPEMVPKMVVCKVSWVFWWRGLDDGLCDGLRSGSCGCNIRII